MLLITVVLVFDRQEDEELEGTRPDLSENGVVKGAVSPNVPNLNPSLFCDFMKLSSTRRVCTQMH
jgi:hypothetical protein